MKYTDEQIDAFLDRLDIELFTCQREMFKRLVNSEGRVYFMPGRYQGRSFILEMLNKFYSEVKDEIR